MKNLVIRISFIIVTFLVSTALLWAQSEEEEKINEALDVLEDLTEAPEEGIPPVFFNKSEAIAIFPGVIKAGLIVGGRHGKGIVMIKDEQGNWSNPAFVSLSGGSFGLQIGAQSADIVLLFREKETVRQIKEREITLGGDAAVAAGPLGREIGTSTNPEFSAEVYSYARSRGLFAGLTIEGSVISVNESANQDFYDDPNIDMNEIFIRDNLQVPPVVNRLQQHLKAMR
ncbi:MAG: lipid-binding SYLF domain-containing protein [Bacteroidia bacterium]|nr:lipid-binding SYLF domain-containing protein [Bacteroidia bacterium]